MSILKKKFLDNNAQHIFPGKAENKDGAILGLF